MPQATSGAARLHSLYPCDHREHSPTQTLLVRVCGVVNSLFANLPCLFSFLISRPQSWDLLHSDLTSKTVRKYAHHNGTPKIVSTTIKNYSMAKKS